jgi:hypothetical protein
MRSGQKGTKKLVGRLGSRLLFVHYRYDARLTKRFTTVELIVAETDWTPPASPIARVRVEYWEAALRRDVKAAGAKWDQADKLWLLPLDRVRELGLKGRSCAD